VRYHPVSEEPSVSGEDDAALACGKPAISGTREHAA
jgi:hypothetical protein